MIRTCYFLPMYSLLSKKPFCMPTGPGPNPVYYGPGTPIINTNGSLVVDALRNLMFQANPMIDCTTQATINANFVWARNYWLSYQNIKWACYNMLDGSIGNAFKFSLDPNLTGWNPSVTIETIWTNLSQRMVIQRPMRSSKACVYSPNNSPEFLFRRIGDWLGFILCGTLYEILCRLEWYLPLRSTHFSTILPPPRSFFFPKTSFCR